MMSTTFPKCPKYGLTEFQENEQLRQMINKLRIEKELLLDMLAEITADFKTQKAN